MLALAVSTSAKSQTLYYRNNTVCSEGFYLRRLEHRVTDQWYMLTPLDISREGEQSINLIAGNCYVIGKVQAVVKGDTLTLRYSYLDGIQPHSELLMLYLNFEEVNSVDPDLLSSPYRFGEAISISGALKGQPLIYLYVNNRVSFTSGVKGLVVYSSFGKAEMERRITMAESAGLGEVYREFIPAPVIQGVQPDASQPEVPGLVCEDGYCYVPRP